MHKNVVTQGPFEFYKKIEMVDSDVRYIFLNSLSFSVNEDIVATSILFYYITSVILWLPCLLWVINDITGTTVTTTAGKIKAW